MNSQHIEGKSRIPFVLANGQKPPKMNFQRIMEQVLGAAIIAAIVLYGTVRVLDYKFESLNEHLHRVEKRVDKIYQDVYRPEFGRRSGP